MRVYADGFLITGQSSYREGVEDIFRWVQREMTSPEGAFYSAIDSGEVGRFVVLAGAGCVELAGIGLRVLDPLRGGRMGREEIWGARIDVQLPRAGFQLGVATHRGEKAHRAVRIIASARGDADPDAVRLEFLST